MGKPVVVLGCAGIEVRGLALGAWVIAAAGAAVEVAGLGPAVVEIHF